MRNFGLLFIILTIACSQPKLSDVLSNKIELFLKYENDYFKNIGIRSLARNTNQKSPLQFEVTRSGKPGHAIIETKPEIRIIKNYYDSITIDFVRVFSKLDLKSLYNYDSGQISYLGNKPITHLEFRFGQEGIILFKGSPYRNNDSTKAIIENSTPIDNQWRYTIVKESAN